MLVRIIKKPKTNKKAPACAHRHTKKKIDAGKQIMK